MITSIYIKDFIIFDEVKLQPENGLNVLTGETGSGKSIIINSIDIAFGGKTSSSSIKNEAKKAFIEIEVNLNENFDKTIFEENGIEIDDDILVISREITKSSSRSRINGVLVTQDFMKKIRPLFLDIHSQNQTYKYMAQNCHINLLDEFGGSNHKKEVEEYGKLYKKWIFLKNEAERLRKEYEEREKRKEFVKYQINEIESANIKSLTEDVDLEKELEILTNAEKIKQLARSSYEDIENEDMGALKKIGHSISELEKISCLDSSIEDIKKELEEASDIIRDASISIRQYYENIDDNPEAVIEIQSRIEVLDNLKRKYGYTLENVLKSLEDCKSELNLTETTIEKSVEYQEQADLLKKDIIEKAEKLSEQRKILSEKLSEYVIDKLKKLEMPKARFSVSCEKDNLGEYGQDRVEFLVSTNISQPMTAMSKTASGGEISRIMLALKSIFAEKDKTDTIIFDEIDTGISGKASKAVAEELSNLAKHHQVIIITHQGVIAAKASKYFYVEKKQDQKTTVSVRILEGEEKLKALSFMVFGKTTDESIKSAELLI